MANWLKTFMIIIKTCSSGKLITTGFCYDINNRTLHMAEASRLVKIAAQIEILDEDLNT